MRRFFVVSLVILIFTLSVGNNAHAGDMGSDLLDRCRPHPRCEQMNLAVASSVDSDTGVVTESISFSVRKGKFVSISTPPDWTCHYKNKTGKWQSGWGLYLKHAVKGKCTRFSGVEELP